MQDTRSRIQDTRSGMQLENLNNFYITGIYPESGILDPVSGIYLPIRSVFLFISFIASNNVSRSCWLLKALME